METARAYLGDLWNTPRAAGVVAADESQVIGFALGRAEQRDRGLHFYLSEMCVLSSCQGQGVGKELMAGLETTLKAQGVGKITLLTARDRGVERFYHACGFYTSAKMAMLGKHL